MAVNPPAVSTGIFEKDAGRVDVNDSFSGDHDADAVKDWSDAEETSVRRRTDLILIPILGLAFFALQIDRGNISSALTSTITEDLNITTNQINVGTQLLSAGIVVSEIPSNVLLQIVGPQRWLSAQLFAWGFVATFQAFITTYPAYLVTRLLLGLLEGGFIPGALYYMSQWYKKGETSLRTSLFFFGQMFASATSNLISAGLLQLSGKSSLAGWQWIFLVEGLITIFAGIVFVLLVPRHAGDGKPLLSRLTGGRWSYFTERESQIIRQRVLLDDPLKTQGHVKITGRNIWDTVRQPRIIQHFFITLLAICTLQGLGTYVPSMIKGFGFSAVQANALSSVSVYCGMILLLALSFAADKTGHRGPFVLIAITWNVIAFPCLRTLPQSSGKWHKYGALAASYVSYASTHVLNIGWLSVNCKSPQERSVAMALIIMAANAAGIAGSQIFRTEDKPLYHRGLTAICAIAAACWCLTVILNVQYFLLQKRRRAL
ncbi:putative MFS transporter [Aspergillus steynii IBT 23096]|uniref:Putative MFS transporter n=1 Tax=Aspergillus steynii IBT 23096 TaxID=1392250 RepID=A0A2I2GEP6_9EURO|nr:putative MFS transporter [Aspergillus steynii IBT 23096]PLB51365.1 putative MFS transporter [Aspergillus steynii IBT 23096]